MRYGTFSEEELLDMAVEHGLESVALTDINNTSACLNFVRLAKQKGIKPIIGVDCRNGAEQQYVLIARNNDGFKQINAFVSPVLSRKRDFPARPPSMSDVAIIYPFSKAVELELEENGSDPEVRFRETCLPAGRSEYIGISLADMRKLPFTRFIKMRERLVVQQPVTFRDKRDFNAHRLLRAIDLNKLLSKLPETEQGSPDDRLYPLEEVEKVFANYPFILENTRQLMEDCQVDFDFETPHRSLNQATYTGDRDKDFQLLRQLCMEGLPRRYPDQNKQIIERMEKEIATIARMNFVSYFLINWRICKYARDKGYFYVGRGSGANSIVAYLLHITEVDPVELDLYFERFINDYRTSPPDFDLDFSWDDREDITAFIFSEFKNVALLATYNTFQYRAVVRELGKVFGLPKADIDALSAGTMPRGGVDQLHKLVIKYGELIQGMPNYISIHAGGILITEEDIHSYSATDVPPKGFPTVQFDMHIAEDVGIHKFDILAQRGLGKIRDTVAIIQENQPRADIHDIHDVKYFKNDPKINEMISQARCIGCFYVESPAMRMLLNKLQTRDYLGLVAASSIIRPGVSKSGMMREYIARHRYPEKRKEAHPILNRIMPDTYGIMVYQEDVIKVAHFYAKLDLGEADVLRRGMSGKYRSRAEFKKIEQRYFDNCRELGYPREEAEEIWFQIKSFAGYAFAKGHSASYAVESYQSLYLKRYFPLEYMTAVLNNGGGFYRVEQYIHEARMNGGTIEAPCVNRSQWLCSIDGTTIFIGFGFLKELERRTAERLITERNFNGPFKGFDDFIDRVPIGMEQLAILVRIDAFRFTGRDRYQLLWQAYFKLDKQKNRSPQARLFAAKHRQLQVPDLRSTEMELAFEQMELLGFPLRSPFDLLKELPRNALGKRDMKKYLGKKMLLYGYLVTVKNTKTHKGKHMHFATFTDCFGEFFDIVLFPPVAQRLHFRGSGIYACYGTVAEEFDFTILEVEKMKKMDYIEDPRYAESNPQTMQRLEKRASLLERKAGGEKEPRDENQKTGSEHPRENGNGISRMTKLAKGSKHAEREQRWYGHRSGEE